MINSFTIAHRKQAGITLVETAIALAIAAVVVSAAFAGFQANARRSEVRDNSQLISEMVADAKQLFGPTNRYSVLDTAKAVAARIVPNNLHTSASTAINSYGGAVEFVSAGSATDPNDQAKLVFSGVPKNQCVDLALSVERNMVGMLIVASGSTTGIDRTESATSTAAKTNSDVVDTQVVSKVTDACNATSSNNKYDMHLFFARN